MASVRTGLFRAKDLQLPTSCSPHVPPHSRSIDPNFDDLLASVLGKHFAKGSQDHFIPTSGLQLLSPIRRRDPSPTRLNRSYTTFFGPRPMMAMPAPVGRITSMQSTTGMRVWPA